MKKKIKFLIIVLLTIIVFCIVIISVLNKGKNKDTDIEEATPPPERYSKVKEKYECNEFEFENVTIDQLILIYFNSFKHDIINDTDKAYKTLDEQYRKEKFGSIENFKQYTENNYEKIMESTLVNYRLDNSNKQYSQYICTDQNGNYIIFRETAVMQFTIILDAYTIDLPEFVEKYNSTNEQGKVALNIQKFTQALNEKDYKYAYNCLSNGFKENNFNTLEDFENYIKDNWFENFGVEYKDFEEDSGLYKYTIIMRNKNEEVDEEITKTIIMKLNKETDFEMSFDV